MSIAIFASIHAKPEHRNAVLQALQQMVSASRSEPGNLRYDLFERDGAPGTFDLYELYVDHEAVEAHRQSAHYADYRQRTAAWLASPPEVKLSLPLDLAP
ncbi:putative quinol monooxygenase [Pseudomonas sp. GOM7]|uniref:putative quinol monooxygenase n=1 Tax=unclassified Pseudomonas TaxID=196821 RepID=UPI00227A5369|nr:MULTISPECIES: putative quinol monooxygenase [unclassified Pseudomonas]WAJ36934.1 putative quinol monooxygenase [Pseudomonas sp. GOM7]